MSSTVNSTTFQPIRAPEPRPGSRQAQLLQDIDRRLHELCPIPQQGVRAAVPAADESVPGTAITSRP